MKKNIRNLILGLCLLTKADHAFSAAAPSTASEVRIESGLIGDIPVARALGLAQLHQMNAWFAHERFWAAGGVIDPHTYEQQQAQHATFAGTPMAFLQDLSSKLATEMGAIGAVPTPESVEDLVRRSQQILLTIAAGTPVEGGFSRLNPANAADWEIIRKAMFLALSVTEDPEKGGKSCFTPVYDLANYYYQKTDSAAIKEYYVKLEAYGFGFSTFWKGLKEAQTNAVIQTKLAELRDAVSDPLYSFIRNNPTSQVQRNTFDPIYRGAYASAINTISVADSRTELAAALALHPRLNHMQVFKTLHPDLTMWAEYHMPSAHAEELMGSVRPRILLPADFQPKRIHLAYVAGKWLLKGINGAREHILWTQGASATTEFIGAIEDDRGTHLFNFKVDGVTAIIKAISLGYGFNAENDGTNVIVADGDELGLIESSAYPEDTDVENFADGSIVIKANRYLGMRGWLSARRHNVIITTPPPSSTTTIDLNYPKGFEVRTHSNGSMFNFLVNKGQGIDAHNSIMLHADSIALNQCTMRSGFTIQMYRQANSNNYLRTDGTDFQTAYLFLANDAWHTDVGVTYAGSTRDPYQKFDRVLKEAEAAYYEAAKAPVSNRTNFDIDRVIAFDVGNLFTRDDAEYHALLNGPHIWGVYVAKENTNPTFGLITYTEMPASEYYRGSRGRGFPGISRPFPGGPVSVSSWAPSNIHLSAAQKIEANLARCGGGVALSEAPSSFRNVFRDAPTPASIATGGGIASLASSLIPAGVTEQSVEFGMGSRDGDIRAHVNLSLESRVDRLAIAAGYTTGVSGRSLDLESAYSGSDGVASVLHDIHALTTAGIMQLTDRRTDRLSMGAVIDGAIFVGSKIPSVVKWSRNLASAILLSEDASEKAEADAKVAAEKSTSSAATGGPKGQLPDGEDPEKEENHTQVKDGDFLNEHDALEEAEKFLGEGYTNPSKDRYVSADGTRQVRMKDRDVLGKHAGGPHIHLEYIGGTNAHVYLK